MIGCQNSDTLQTCPHLVHVSLPCELCFINKRIEKLEKEIKPDIFEQMKQYKFLCDQINILNNRVNSLEDKKPYKCPICEGCGKSRDKLVAEPYDQQIKVLVNPNCHSCEGKGIVWGQP